MLKIENSKVFNLEAAIRGMRAPMQSWNKSDSQYCMFGDPYGYQAWSDCLDCELGNGENKNKHCEMDSSGYVLGPNDLKLAKKLAAAGPVHAKYRRMIFVSLDVTAPLYWWKEYDTYKIGTVANSTSTMHKIQAKEFTLDDFSHEHLITPENGTPDDKFVAIDIEGSPCLYSPTGLLAMTCTVLNRYRELYLKTHDKKHWWQMIQLLPSSYNQKRTITLNYEVLAGLYPMRKDHKLDEWHTFCEWIESLPYSVLITGKEKENDNSNI